ncbi:MAG: LPXTG cell wall anchor domain-containing protein [Oscillospiraceae bacterium]|nr:LPXTG cell wall anchor domain-containing protein [Oscillospiraceae bacterium]
MKVTKILAATAATVVAAASLAATAGAYNAYVGFQTAVYSFRNGWTDKDYGKDTAYFNSAIVWGSGDAPEETFPEYADNFDWDITGYVLDATYTDATVNGDGTYTVSVDSFDWAVDKATGLNLAFVSTDIPVDSGAVITNAKLIVDGAVTADYDSPVTEGTDYIQINMVNIWNTDVAAYSGAYPTETLAIEFTVSGLGGGAAAETPSDDGADTTTPSGTKDSPDTGVEGVAAVAGLAIVAGGAVVLSKKRK